MRIYFDVETIPSQIMGAREVARAEVKCPASYKKPESIAGWWASEGEAAIERAYRDQALDATQGELVAISWAEDGGEVQTLIRERGGDERELLSSFFAGIQGLLEANAVIGVDGRNTWNPEPYFIAHNAAFDLGFVWRRAVILNVRPSFNLPAPGRAKEGKDYGDSMAAWAGFRGTVSLHRLCLALGIPSPKASGMDGGAVFDHWLSGQYEEIAAYNQADVLAVRSIWQRLNWEVQA